MRRQVGLIAIAVLALGSSPALAQEAVPSCYRAARLNIAAPPPTRSVFILVDQTTALGDLTATIAGSLDRLLLPGTAFSVATFSAFSRGHYTTVIRSGTIERPVDPPRRRSLPVTRLAALDRCLIRQRQFAVRMASAALNQAARTPATVFANSEIMASLAQLSERVRSAPGAERIVIVGSDLLEHSSAATFYASRGLRLIDPNAELRNGLRLGLLGNFGRARIYVVGTGLLPGQGVRDIRALNALIRFWTMWFTRSNAGSITIGRPDLVSPIN